MVYYMDKNSIVFNFLIVLILSSSSSLSFANVDFVTRPPENLDVFPSQNVSLQCTFTNLIHHHHIIQWDYFPDIFTQKTISQNRQVLIEKIENVAEHYSILGNGMNYTLLIKIPDRESLDFGISDNIKTLYRCSIYEPSDQTTPVKTTATTVTIQNLPHLYPICVDINETFIVGETLTAGCYQDSYQPDIITTLQLNGQILPTTLFQGYNTHKLILTKENHNSVFVCVSKVRGTNEIRNCSVGPITVNYKPDITITEISLFEFRCTVEARPPVSLTHWIVEPTIPENNFIISHDILRFTEKMELQSVNVTCWANNSIGDSMKTIVLNNQESSDIKENAKEIDGIKIALIVVTALFIMFIAVFVFTIYHLKSKGSSTQIIENDDTTTEDGYQLQPLKASNPQYQILIKGNDNLVKTADDTMSVDGYLTPVNPHNQSLIKENEQVQLQADDTNSEHTMSEDGYQIPAKVNHHQYQSLIKENEKVEMTYDDTILEQNTTKAHVHEQGDDTYIEIEDTTKNITTGTQKITDSGTSVLSPNTEYVNVKKHSKTK